MRLKAAVCAMGTTLALLAGSVGAAAPATAVDYALQKHCSPGQQVVIHLQPAKKNWQLWYAISLFQLNNSQQNNPTQPAVVGGSMAEATIRTGMSDAYWKTLRVSTSWATCSSAW